MASAKIEAEIDEFANNYPLKRRSLLDRHRMVNNSRDYDRIWKQVLKDMAETQFLDNVL